MTLQWAGPILGSIMLGTIAIGHVIVRRLNYLHGTKPAPVFAVIGIASLLISIILANDLLSACFGIIGVTTIWDAIELVRQEERVRRGHAPANPNRPVEPSRKEN